MIAEAEKREIAKKLQAKINMMQGMGKLSGEPIKSGVLPFAQAFPNQTFPTGCIHEFISYETSSGASTTGFITALTGKIMTEGGLCLWIGSERKIFPLGLTHFGLQPDRIVFINPKKIKDTLWIIEEALKCDALAIVIGEIHNLGFTESRRLQLAVERSGVTGFIHSYRCQRESTSACTARWKITPLSSLADDGLPGVGHHRWDVQLLKVKNGKPNSWEISWAGNQFTQAADTVFTISSMPNLNAV